MPQEFFYSHKHPFPSPKAELNTSVSSSSLEHYLVLSRGLLQHSPWNCIRNCSLEIGIFCQRRRHLLHQASLEPRRRRAYLSAGLLGIWPRSLLREVECDRWARGLDGNQAWQWSTLHRPNDSSWELPMVMLTFICCYQNRSICCISLHLINPGMNPNYRLWLLQTEKKGSGFFSWCFVIVEFTFFFTRHVGENEHL